MSIDPPPYVPYAQREGWQDLTPIPQDEPGSNPLAPIFYGEAYKDATEYFRALVKAGERSARVLEITENIIKQNPSHYSVWQYRYDTLLAMNADLAAELDLMNDIASRFLKSYQVWHHRRLLMTHIRIPRPELVFIANALQQDVKNYHTWSYRQWILAEFNEPDLWEGEIPFIETMLSDDLRNNSAWHHRFFVVWESGVREGEENRDLILKRELNFTKQKLALAPNNPSAWNYLRGVLAHTKTPFTTLEKFIKPYAQTRPQTGSEASTATTLGETLFEDLDNPSPSDKASLPCPQAMEFLAEIYEEKCVNLMKLLGYTKPVVSQVTRDNTEASINKAVALYASLASEYDTMRRRYWEYRQREAAKLVPSVKAP